MFLYRLIKIYKSAKVLKCEQSFPWRIKHIEWNLNSTIFTGYQRLWASKLMCVQIIQLKFVIRDKQQINCGKYIIIQIKNCSSFQLGVTIEDDSSDSATTRTFADTSLFIVVGLGVGFLVLAVVIGAFFIARRNRYNPYNEKPYKNWWMTFQRRSADDVDDVAHNVWNGVFNKEFSHCF